MALYHDFETVDDLNYQYVPIMSGVDSAPYFEGWPKQSAKARKKLDGRLDVAFGPTRDEYLDIFPAGDDATPVHLFIHGGYWRYFTAKDFSFVAETLVDAGISVAVTSYSLCPKVTIDEIVRQARAALAWLMRHAKEFGGDPANITVSGHSAGAHLAAMVAQTDWAGDYGLDPNVVRAVIGVSGVYDLRPIRYTDVQGSLQFTGDQIARCSPLFHVRQGDPPIWLAVGGEETPEFQRQTAAYAQALRQAGVAVEEFAIPGANHFEVMDDYNDPGSRLFKLITEQARKGG